MREVRPATRPYLNRKTIPVHRAIGIRYDMHKWPTPDCHSRRRTKQSWRHRRMAVVRNQRQRQEHLNNKYIVFYLGLFWYILVN